MSDEPVLNKNKPPENVIEPGECQSRCRPTPAEEAGCIRTGSKPKENSEWEEPDLLSLVDSLQVESLKALGDVFQMRIDKLRKVYDDNSTKIFEPIIQKM